jgi:hypothetical protein
MKARSFIVRALLFALVLAPAAMRVSAKPLGAPSSRVANPRPQAIDGRVQTSRILDQFASSRRRPHAPAPRLHRIHGKKINLQTGVALASQSCALTHVLIADARVRQQDMGGPNPSRGPPSQFSL